MSERVDIAETSAPEAIARHRRWLVRTPLRQVSFARLFFGGRIDDLGRLPRYFGLLALGLCAVWGPVLAYFKFAPVRYASTASLILPGSGPSNSVNLADLGQASSYAASPYSSASMSPTVTYKKLLGSGPVLKAAAAAMGEPVSAFGSPRVKLVDLTGLVVIEMRGATPEQAQARATKLTESFLGALDGLRKDELKRREATARDAIREYELSVSDLRRRITALQITSGLSSTDQFDQLVRDKETLAARLRDREARLSLIASKAEALASVLRATPNEASQTMRLHADPEFRALARAMALAAAALAEVRGQFGERHPTLAAARERLAGARAQMRRRAASLTGLRDENLIKEVDLSTDGARVELLAELVRLNVEKIGLEAERDALSEKSAAVAERVRDLTESAAELDDLKRDYQVAEAVFASALARVDTSKADLYASYPLVQMLEPASRPERPSSPKKLIAIAAGVAGTFCLLMALALAWVRKPAIDWLIRRATTS